MHDPLGPQIPIMLLARNLSTGDLSRRTPNTDSDLYHGTMDESTKPKETEKENEHNTKPEKKKKQKKISLPYVLTRSKAPKSTEHVDVIPYNPCFQSPTVIHSPFSVSTTLICGSPSGQKTPTNLKRVDAQSNATKTSVTPLPNLDQSPDDEVGNRQADWDACSEITLIHSASLNPLHNRRPHVPSSKFINDQAQQPLSQPTTTSTFSTDESFVHEPTKAPPMLVSSKLDDLYDIHETDYEGDDFLDFDEDQPPEQEVRKKKWNFLKAKNLKPKYIALRLDQSNDALNKKGPSRPSPQRKPSRTLLTPSIPVSSLPPLSADDLGKVNAFFAPSPQLRPVPPPKDHIYLHEDNRAVLDISRANLATYTFPYTVPDSTATSSYEPSLDDSDSTQSAQSDWEDLDGPIYFTIGDFDRSHGDDIEILLLERSPFDEDMGILHQDSLTVNPGWGRPQVARPAKHPPLPGTEEKYRRPGTVGSNSRKTKPQHRDKRPSEDLDS
ncbi:hypothetical protein VKT23_008350 [Stygiomarasmius scandens]|uniref:Uncharacterized protein n=1 Tax=Marasmiellus scandens TaxID=2682957 RepID=A0ABR1JKH5_9AGAR